ncbi:ATP-binding protein [Frankia sp. CNm7]|uniref:ATP-binding protein n=2 Tax=Frankia nepalensis TaxID=1836974 RepID=A0A937RLX3_9ACTN|nr:ATP-binding protein [Frankia nepalensis]MBL7501107.1 ATP-binding protein [Frankia nepalensis]MBL7512729.1 ATP-binding protein [Frankia nepalensis]MBL7524119.1 ATP-binding protein [Frankia nepalensis]MBL7631315.1 ATP-binding protein [Frankia nepalensis]
MVLDTFTVPASPRSPRTARLRAADVLARHGCASALVDTAVLLLSEVVTNAVVHAHSAARIEVRATRRLVWFGVRDTDSRQWPVQLPTNLGASGGRGLQLIATLAAGWGTYGDDDAGKTVWFWLRR